MFTYKHRETSPWHLHCPFCHALFGTPSSLPQSACPAVQVAGARCGLPGRPDKCCFEEAKKAAVKYQPHLASWNTGRRWHLLENFRSFQLAKSQCWKFMVFFFKNRRCLTASIFWCMEILKQLTTVRSTEGIGGTKSESIFSNNSKH